MLRKIIFTGISWTLYRRYGSSGLGRFSLIHAEYPRLSQRWLVFVVLCHSWSSPDTRDHRRSGDRSYGPPCLRVSAIGSDALERLWESLGSRDLTERHRDPRWERRFAPRSPSDSEWRSQSRKIRGLLSSTNPNECDRWGHVSKFSVTNPVVVIRVTVVNNPCLNASRPNPYWLTAIFIPNINVHKLIIPI